MLYEFYEWDGYDPLFEMVKVGQNREDAVVYLQYIIVFL